MEYKLVTDNRNYHNKENRFIIIDSKAFDKNSNLIDTTEIKKQSDKSLMEIVNFTTSFNTKEELMNYLIMNQLIPEGRNKDHLHIISSTSKDEIHVLPAGVPLKGDAYLYNLYNLRNYLHTNSNNIPLLQEIFYTFQGSLAHGKGGEVFRNLFNYIRNEGFIDEYDNPSINSTLSQFFDLLTRNKKREINYSEIHKLVMLISNFERKQLKKINEEKKEELDQKSYYEYYLKRLEHISYLLNNDTLLPHEKEILEKEQFQIEMNLGIIEGVDNNDFTRH